MAEEPSRPIESISGCFVRVVWLFLGPALAFLMAALLAVDGRKIGMAGDAALGAIVALTILARIADDPQARPSRGAYAIVALLIGIAFWVLARLISGTLH